MQDEFGFNNISSVEFCVSTADGDEHGNYLIPCDENVQNALKEMLHDTAAQLENDIDDHQEYELSEKYASREALVGDLAADEMTMPRSLFDEEGWEPNPGVLAAPETVSYYFAVYRDNTHRKLIAVRRAAQFKGVVKSRLIRLFDDSLQLMEDRLFKLDRDFDFLITSQHVFILHPTGFENVAEIEELVTAKACEKARALGTQVRFADFTRIEAFVARHKRAARLVAALSARDGLAQIQRSRFISAAAETSVSIEDVGRKIGPALGSEIAFLELLDHRRYTTAIKTGPKEAFVANSRKQIR
jgi:hypothetical protein